MKHIVEKTVITPDDVIIDLNYLRLQLYKNPLIIAVREGQIARINQWLQRNQKTNVDVVGWWDLVEKDYIDKKVGVKPKLKKYDMIIFLDPTRCSDQKLYLKLIKLLGEHK